MSDSTSSSNKPEDVAEEEAESIAEEISAKPVKEERLTARTSDDPA
jgi:hypothetical protein